MKNFSRKAVVFITLSIVFFISVGCDQSPDTGWLTYRHDNQRSAFSTDSLALPLSLHWSFTPKHAPRPAWYDPAEENPRMHQDIVHHVTSNGKMVYWGSPIDNKVYALDAETGKIRWTFFTEGPVRFAPAISNGRLYFGSDDGFVYCVDASNGDLNWKYRAAPSAEKVLGNGRMISLWPVRTSVLVEEGVAYFVAGVFPYEGIYVNALDAKSGNVIWKNDGVGDMMHEQAFGGISPFGYLLASKDVLYVPSGRAMPAAFNRKTGEFLSYLSAAGKTGGTWGLVSDEELIAGVEQDGFPAKVAFDDTTLNRKGNAFAAFPGIDLVLTPETAFILTQDRIYAVDREKYQTVSREIEKAQSAAVKLHNSIQAKVTPFLQKNKNKAQFTAQTQQLQQLLAVEDSLKTASINWQAPVENINCLVLTKGTLFAAGNGSVMGLDSQTGTRVWADSVAGTVYGLAATPNQLFATTDEGKIYCFASGEKTTRQIDISKRIENPFSDDSRTELYAKSAEYILKNTHIERGYCLVLGCGDGRLAWELAQQSQLNIIALDTDEKRIAAAKENLDATGLYGTRITIESWPLAELPDYFADLIVSDKFLVSGKLDEKMVDIYRVLKPCGGVVFLGNADSEMDLADWQFTPEMPKPEIVTDNGQWLKLVRPALPGAGSWRQQYANAQNTGCSDDHRVKGPLGVLWFGAPGPSGMLERHSKAASPVAADGRMFIQGREEIMAYDAYNGTELWKVRIPGAIRARADVDGGNLTLTEKGLFVAAGSQCYRLDPATGKIINQYSLPAEIGKKSSRWGFISVEGDLLIGSASHPLKESFNYLWNELVTDAGCWQGEENLSASENMVVQGFMEQRLPEANLAASRLFQRAGYDWRFMLDYPIWDGGIHGETAPTPQILASDLVFALDIESGKTLWVYHGKEIANISIALGDGALFLTDNTLNAAQRTTARNESQRLVREKKWEPANRETTTKDIDSRLVVAVDLQTGKKLWQKPLDLTGCGGDALAIAYHDDVLLFFGSIGLHDKWRFPADELTWRRITALSTTSQNVLWSRPLNYMTRPIIIGNTVIIEPRACDLHTGEIKTRQHPISGQDVPWEYYRPGHTCSISAASPDGLFYRSYCAAFYDLEKDNGLTYFGAIRPGCWINMVPANGLLLFPESSSGCTCSFPLRSSVVLKTKNRAASGVWGVFITHGPTRPVKNFAINLGAPGDRRDETGTMWFGYPRPKTSYGIKFDLQEDILPGMGYFAKDVRYSNVKAPTTPWVFHSGCIGFRSCTIPLVADFLAQPPQTYTVKLGFLPPAGKQSQHRKFDIKLQDQVVQSDFKISKRSKNKAVIKTFKGISVTSNLKIELVPSGENPDLVTAPVLNSIEICEEINENAQSLSEPAQQLSGAQARALLKYARLTLQKTDSTESLDLFHQVYDTAPTIDLKKKALMGMATISSPLSLSRILPYCRDTNKILWEYQKPNPGLQQNAMRLYVNVMNKFAQTDADKAIRGLQHGWKITEDFDNRYAIATSLERLGLPVDVEPRKNGYLTRWSVCGPFPWDQEKNPLSRRFVNEPDIDLNGIYHVDGGTKKWHKFMSDAGVVDIVKHYGAKRLFAIYAHAEFILPADQELILKIGSDDGFRCWMNKKFVGEFDNGRGFALDSDVFRVSGKAGVNSLLLKVFNWAGDSSFDVHLFDLDGNPLYVEINE